MTESDSVEVVEAVDDAPERSSRLDLLARRRVVTTEGLGIAESLLGRRLASPSRRLGALLIDLALVAVLTSLTTGLWLATVVAGVVLWLCMRGARGWWSWTWRGTVGLVTALVAFLVVVGVTWDGMTYGGSVESWEAFGEAMASQDPEMQQAALEQLTDDLDQGMTEADKEAIGGLSGLPIVGTLFDGDDGTSDKIAALEAKIRDLRRQMLDLSSENQRLRAELDDPSLLRSVEALAGDLGLKVGWAGVYFLLFPALWRGRTPGKRLLRLQVVRLDDRPLTVWHAFERLGGYAAGLATGLLGFLQITWDPNRQGVHDKIVSTVVVVEEPTLQS